jgi:hypothetical protein
MRVNWYKIFVKQNEKKISMRVKLVQKYVSKLVQDFCETKMKRKLICE